MRPTICVCRSVRQRFGLRSGCGCGCGEAVALNLIQIEWSRGLLRKNQSADSDWRSRRFVCLQRWLRWLIEAQSIDRLQRYKSQEMPADTPKVKATHTHTKLSQNLISGCCAAFWSLHYVTQCLLESITAVWWPAVKQSSNRATTAAGSAFSRQWFA